MNLGDFGNGEQLMDLVLRASQDGLIAWDLVRREVRYSERWYHMFGYDRDEWEALGNAVSEQEFWLEKVHPDERTTVREALAEHLTSGWPFGVTVRMAHRSGGYRYTLCRGASEEDGNGTRHRMVIVFSSIDEQVRGEERQRALLAGLPDTIFRVDAGGTVVGLRRGNEREGSPFGKLQEGMRLSDASELDERIRVELSEFGKVEGDSEREMKRLKLTKRDGHYEIRAIPSLDGELVCVVRDITEQHALEMQLLESQKLGAIGQLAAGVAHEINTPMQFIGDSLHFSREALTDIIGLTERLREIAIEHATDGDAVRAAIEAADAAADFEYVSEALPKGVERSLMGVERVTKIVRALKTFAHPSDGNLVPTDLRTLVESTVEVATNEWKYVATVTMNFPENLRPVACYPGELSQVVLNLLVNAAHAIGDVVGNSGEKGRIEISVEILDREAEIRVKDTGTGIPEAARPRIFEQFFTTKEVGRGTGQGLSMAYSCVVVQHGGALEFETEMGVGTTFIIRIPLEPNEKRSIRARASISP